MSAALVALVAAATAPTGLSLAQNLAWPSADPTLGAAALADPRLMPDDPAYAPSGPECAGQRAWWSFTPPCARALGESERGLGVGVGVDRAWLRTIGRADVTSALLVVDTPDLASRALARRVRLAAGELPPVDVGDGRPSVDRDGDGVSTLADWVDEDGRALDVRLRARGDGGDVDGDGRVDPFDLAAVFADGRDDDGNGLVDDILGWDLVRDAPLGRATRSTPSGALARALVEEANDGDGGVGVCPRCTVRVFVVGDDVTGHLAARALRALDPAGAGADGGRALVALLEPTPAAAGAALLDAVAAARAAGIAVVAGLDARGGVSVAPAWDRLATAGPLGPNDLALADWTSAFVPTPGATTAASTRVASPEPARAILAGALLLAQSRARDVRGVDVRLDPETLDALLAATATRLPGSDGRTTLAAGAGRLDARALVDAAERAAPVPTAHLVAPAPWALVDPTRGTPVEVVIESAAQGERYSLSIASGVDVAPSAWSVIARGALDIPRLTLGVDIVGLERDPLAPPGPPLSRAHTLRLVVEPPPGGAGPPREVRRTIYVHRDAELLVGFPLELGAPVHVTPRVFPDDVGDTIVVADDAGRVSRIDLRGTPRPGWPARLALAEGPGDGTDRPVGAPVVFELDDGRRAWATLGASGRLHVLDADGRAVEGFPRAVPEALVDEGAWLAVDVDVEEGVTLLVGTRRGVAGFDRAGTPRAGFPLDLGARPSAPALLGRRWVFTADGALRAFDLAGEVTTVVGLDTNALEAPLVGAVRGGRRLRAVVPSPPFRVFVADLQGELFEADVPFLGGLADLGERPFEDGDILRLFRLGPGGRALAAPRGGDGFALLTPLVDTATIGWLGAVPLGDDADIAAPPLAMRTRLASTPSAIDVDGDGTVELVAPDDEERLRAIGPSGPLRGWPKLLGAPLAGAPQVARAGAGGALIAVTTRGRVLAYRLDGDPDRAAVWLGPRHDARNTASLDTPVRADVAASGDDGASCATAPRGPQLVALGLVLLVARPRRRGARSGGARR